MLRVLDSQQPGRQQLVRDGGEVFQALSERQGQLRGLIQNSNAVFSTTAHRNQELAEHLPDPADLPARVARDARRASTASRPNTDPLVQQLRPAAQELSPTLIAAGKAAPDLKAFFDGLRGAIAAARPGLPALQRLLDNDLPPLLARLDPYLAQFNSIFEGLRLYRREITATFANITAASLSGVPEGSDNQFFRFIRTEAPLGPQAISAFPRRLQIERNNPYFAPGGLDNLLAGLDSYETRHCATGIRALLDPGDAGAFPGNLFSRIQTFAYNGETDSNDIYGPGGPGTLPCTQQPDQDSVGEPAEQTQYQHFYGQGAP